MQEMPYFLTNDEWYTKHQDENGYVKYELTPGAPSEAVESYNEFYSSPIFYDEDGERMDFSGYVIS